MANSIEECRLIDGNVCEVECHYLHLIKEQALCGGWKEDGTLAGALWKWDNWLRFGKRLLFGAIQDGCACLAPLVINYIVITMNKALHDELRASGNLSDGNPTS